MIRLGFKERLALWHMAVVAVLLAVTAVAADWAFARMVLGQVDAALLTLAGSEADSAAAEPGATLRVHEHAPGTGSPSFVRLDKFIQIAALDGRVVAASANLGTARLPVTPALLARLREGETVFQTLEHFGEEPVRMVAVPIDVQGDRYAIMVAGSLDDANAVLHSARLLFLLVSLAILTAVGATGALLTRRALGPIDQIVRQARRIGEANLAERLPAAPTPDEIGRLVQTLNDMLARLERSFDVQRRFTADASHEMRSPLSRLRAELEVTLRRPRESAEYEDALRSCLDEVVRLSRLTEELLTLARLDAGEGSEQPDAVALAPILDEALRRVAPDARRRSVRVALAPSPSLVARAAPGATGLAIANLLENAVKFSPAGGDVVVRVVAEGDDAVIMVVDHGPGVDDDEVERLFERFHRGTASQSSDAPGVGLGLAISRALVERQGGRIAVTSTPGGGATFSVRLPLAAGSTPPGLG
jgi:two-component system, OmpR family, sensor kinase